MRTRRRARLQVERLESRWVPATVQFVSGFLFIRPSTGEAALNLAVTQTAPNTFSVKDGASTLGTYAGVASLNITGGNGADTVTVDLNGLAYTGSLTASTGNGNDTINLTNGSGTAASIGGNVTLLTGDGNDSVSIDAAGNALTIGGTVQLTDTAGSDSLTFGNTAGGVTHIGGDVSAFGYDDVRLSQGQNDVYGGNVAINLGSNPAPGSIAFREGSFSPFLADVVTVSKSLTITASKGDETIALSGVNIGENLGVSLGDSVGTGNLVVMSNNLVTPTVTTVGGNATFTGGQGKNVFRIGGATYNGNVSANVGTGSDTIDLSGRASTPAQATIISGDLRITGGDGNITVADNLLGAAPITINGNAFFNLGSGNDSVTLANAPGGRLFWTSGNGNDSVTFGDSNSVGGQTWNVQMRFGTGNDTITLGVAGGITPANPDFLTGFIDMGGPPGMNVFDSGNALGATPPAWIVVQPFTLQNV
jgi:hypothetical protein